MSSADWQRRFGGIERLYGHKSAQQLQQLHIAVVGIGGVGSWAAEALARSGVWQTNTDRHGRGCASVT